MRGWGNRKQTIEKRLRAERPEPSDELVRSIVSEVRGRSPRSVGRGSFRVVALGLAVIAGLAAIGGLGYAATYTQRVIAVITGSQVVASHASQANAARDQYGTTTTTGSGGSGGTCTPNTTNSGGVFCVSTTTSTQTTGSGGEASSTGSPGSSGSISTEDPNHPGSPMSVDWTGSTFASPVTVSVDPTPNLGSHVFGSATVAVSVTATDKTTGLPVHDLAGVLEIVIANPPAGFVPGFSTDGVHFQELPQISGPPLPAADGAAYFNASDGVHILTRHITIFGMFSKADMNVSERGHAFQPAGSGKFGDPTRIHTGPPVFTIKSGPTARGTKVTFTFYVDEQAAVYLHVLSGTRLLVLNGATSKLGSTALGLKNNKTLHVTVLRPGTIRATLVLLKPASKLKVLASAVDFDGYKVTRTASVGH